LDFNPELPSDFCAKPRFPRPLWILIGRDERLRLDCQYITNGGQEEAVLICPTPELNQGAR
jgi:hypothetical protein